MAEKIKIAHIVSPIELYGKEKWLLALLKHIDRQEFESIVIPITDGRLTKLSIGMRDIGITCHPVIFSMNSIRKSIVHIISIIEQNGIHILHTHDYRADVLGIVAGKKTWCKTMCTPHGWSNVRDLKLQGYQLLDRFLMRFFDKVVPLSTQLARSIRGVRHDKVKLIDNFIDLSDIPEASDYDGKLISYVGRLTRLKRIEDAIASLNHTRDEKIRLQIIGNGELRHKLEAMVNKLELSERVVFYGFRDDSLALLNRSAALVLPSLTEGVSRVAMEAMALGKPVIGTDIPGITAVVKHGLTGFLVPIKNPKAIAEAIDLITSDNGLYQAMVYAAREYIRKNHSAENVTRKYEQLYRSLVLQD